MDMDSDVFWNMKILILDGYNHQIIEGGIIGTVVPNFSRWGVTNGSKIIEVYGEDRDNRQPEEE